MGDPNAAGDFDPALKVALNHPNADRLASFVYDTLMRQASRRGMWAGERVVQKRARKQGIEYQQAETDMGNVLRILGGGPSSENEWALLSALACRGLSDALDNQDDEAAAEAVVRFVDGLLWLEVNSASRLAEYLPKLLQGDGLQPVLEQLQEQLIRDDADACRGQVKARAFNAARVALLQRLPSGAPVLSELAAVLSDPFTLALLDHRPRPTDASMDTKTAAAPASRPVKPVGDEQARVDGATSPAADGSAVENDDVLKSGVGGASAVWPAPEQAIVVVSGTLGHPPAGPMGTVLRVVSGWSFVEPLLHGLLFLVGVRRTASLELRSDGLLARRDAFALGVRYRHSEQVFLPGALRGHGLSLRKPLLGYVIGLLGLCTAAYVGGAMAADGIALVRRDLLLVVIAVLALGAGFDLLVAAAANVGRARVGMVLSVDGRRIALRSVEEPAARRFLVAMQAWAQAAQVTQADQVQTRERLALRGKDEDGAANVV